MNQKNFHAVDLVRFICAILVLIVHTSPFLPFSKLGNFVAINIFGRIAVPFFFITTGYFVHRNTMQRGDIYFKRYIIALLKLYMFWSMIYIPFGIQWVSQNIQLPWFLYPIALIVALVYIGTYFHLWYIPALIFALVLVQWYTKRFSYRPLLIIAFILLCLGTLETYYGVVSNKILVHIIDNYMKVFVTTRNGLFYGLFYVACGYYLVHDTRISRIKHQGILAFVFFGLTVVEAFRLINTNSLNFNFLIMVAPFTVSFFQWLRSIDLTWNLNYAKLREYSNLYYFTHAMFLVLIPLILSYFGYANLFNENGIFRLCSVLICTHLLSMLIYRFRNTRMGKTFNFI